MKISSLLLFAPRIRRIASDSLSGPVFRLKLLGLARGFHS